MRKLLIKLGVIVPSYEEIQAMPEFQPPALDCDCPFPSPCMAHMFDCPYGQRLAKREETKC
jgi:hypothetical protein